MESVTRLSPGDYHADDDKDKYYDDDDDDDDNNDNDDDSDDDDDGGSGGGGDDLYVCFKTSRVVLGRPWGRGGSEGLSFLGGLMAHDMVPPQQELVSQFLFEFVSR